MMRATLITLLVAVAAASALKVHPERQALIDEINSKQSLWKAAAHPRFADQAPGASKSLLGVHMEKNRNTTQRMLQTGEIVMAPRFPQEVIDALPTDFDSATNWPQCAETINDIRDQSACGCCWAFGAAEAASDRMCIATNASSLFPLSAQDMCFCGSFNGCDGGELGPAWSFIKRKGLVTGGQNKGIGPFGAGYCSAFSLPHCHHHGPKGSDPYPSEGTTGCPQVSSSPSCPRQCDSTAAAPHNNFDSDKYTFNGNVVTYPADADQIAAAIMAGGPVEVAFSVYSDFENYAGGIYKHTGGSMLGGHAVKMVGWGEENGTKYWKIANSWNPYWGEKGYFRIVRGTNECGIEGDATSSDQGATWGKKSELKH